MEFRINRNELSEALQITNLAVSQKPVVSILDNVLIEINKKNMTITATDLEVFIKHRMTIDSEASVRFTAPAKKLKDIVASLPDTEITFGFNANKINISADTTKFSISTIPPDDFPKVSVADKEKAIVIQQPILKGLLSKTVFTVAKDSNRCTLTGLCFDVMDKKLNLAATDGRRMAVISYDIDSETDNLQYILPAKAIKQLIQLLQPVGEARIYLDKKLVSFEVNNTILGVRLIEGEFPEYQKIIPKETKIEFNLEREKLIAATRRAAVLTKNGSAVKYSFNSNKLILSSKVPEIGESREEMEIQGSEVMDVAFNPQYIMDALQGINTENIILGVNDNSSPVLIEPLNDGNYIQMLMPMRVE